MSSLNTGVANDKIGQYMTKTTRPYVLLTLAIVAAFYANCALCDTLKHPPRAPAAASRSWRAARQETQLRQPRHTATHIHAPAQPPEETSPQQQEVTSSTADLAVDDAPACQAQTQREPEGQQHHRSAEAEQTQQAGATVNAVDEPLQPPSKLENGETPAAVTNGNGDILSGIWSLLDAPLLWTHLAAFVAGLLTARRFQGQPHARRAHGVNNSANDIITYSNDAVSNDEGPAAAGEEQPEGKGGSTIQKPSKHPGLEQGKVCHSPEPVTPAHTNRGCDDGNTAAEHAVSYSTSAVASGHECKPCTSEDPSQPASSVPEVTSTADSLEARAHATADGPASGDGKALASHLHGLASSQSAPQNTALQESIVAAAAGAVAPPQPAFDSSGATAQALANVPAGVAIVATNSNSSDKQAALKLHLEVGHEALEALLAPIALVSREVTSVVAHVRAAAQGTLALLGQVQQGVEAVKELQAPIQNISSALTALSRYHSAQERRQLAARAVQVGLWVFAVVLLGSAVAFGRLQALRMVCQDGAGAAAAAASSTSRWSVSGWLARRVASQAGTVVGSSGGGMLSTALCYAQQLGLFGVGVVAALWLVLPAALRMVGRESAASSAWPIDLGLILGCLGSAVGVRTVHCLGGSWAVWLVGWWLWCSAGACLYGLSGLRRLGSVVLTLGVSVALPAACGLLPFTPAAVPLQMALEGPMLAAQQRVVNALLALKSALTV